MCQWGTTVQMPIHGRVRDIDQCISHMVAALNAGGIETIASCCGHGRSHGNIALTNGIYLNIHFNQADWEKAEEKLKEETNAT